MFDPNQGPARDNELKAWLESVDMAPLSLPPVDVSGVKHERSRQLLHIVRGRLATLASQQRMSNDDVHAVVAAIRLAWVLHDGDVRSSADPVHGIQLPYITHALDNLRGVLSFGVAERHVLVASVLHDTVEDTSRRYASLVGHKFDDIKASRTLLSDDIAARFGEPPRRVIAGVTNDPEIESRHLLPEERRGLYRDHLALMLPSEFGVFIVKFVDFDDNAGNLEAAEFNNPRRRLRLALKYLNVVDLFRDARIQLIRKDDWPLSESDDREVSQRLDAIEQALGRILAEA